MLASIFHRKVDCVCQIGKPPAQIVSFACTEFQASCETQAFHLAARLGRRAAREFRRGGEALSPLPFALLHLDAADLFISHKLDDLALARAAFKSAFIAFRVIWLDEHQKHPRAAFRALWMAN